MRRTLAPFLLCTSLLPAPITADPPAGDESPLKAAEMVVCEELVAMECRGADKAFGPEVDTVVFYTRIEGATGDAFIHHVYSFEGREVRRVRLPVKSSPYRTWSTKRVKGLPGKWRAEVLDPIGRSLGSVDFVVRPPRESASLARGATRSRFQ